MPYNDDGKRRAADLQPVLPADHLYRSGKIIFIGRNRLWDFNTHTHTQNNNNHEMSK